METTNATTKVVLIIGLITIGIIIGFVICIIGTQAEVKRMQTTAYTNCEKTVLTFIKCDTNATTNSQLQECNETFLNQVEQDTNSFTNQ